jgi:hypothetical protein
LTVIPSSTLLNADTMLTLQTNFTYDDTEPAPIDRATVVVGFPQYEAVDDTATKSVSLVVTGHDQVSFQQRLTSKNYRLAIPTSRLFGTDYGEALIKYLTSLTTQAGGLKISLDDVTIPFDVRFSASDADNPVTFNACTSSPRPESRTRARRWRQPRFGRRLQRRRGLQHLTTPPTPPATQRPSVIR